MLDDLYEVLLKKDDFLHLKLCDKNHAIFKAHFPSNPILPGFILLDICEKEFDFKIKKVKKVSFLKNILPNEILEFHLQKKSLFCHVEIKNAQNLFATIIFS